MTNETDQWKNVAYNAMELLLSVQAQQDKPEPEGWIGYFEGNLVSFLQTQEQVDQFLENTKPAGQVVRVYAEPPKKEWVGLTDADLIELIAFTSMSIEDAKSVEAKLKEKNK